MLIDGYIILLDIPELKNHAAQLQKIGGNINQIAKRMNKTGGIYADDVAEIKQLLGAVGASVHLGAKYIPFNVNMLCFLFVYIVPKTTVLGNVELYLQSGTKLLL